jgi:hypothetical protein
MESANRIERLAAKKAERAKTDRYTRTQFGKSRDIIGKRTDEYNFENKPGVRSNSLMAKGKSGLPSGAANRYSVIAGRDDNVSYRDTPEAKPSASVQKMLKKKKSY